ncbi:hypothetical protein AGIG_G6594 [Arapaima gigas]
MMTRQQGTLDFGPVFLTLFSTDLSQHFTTTTQRVAGDFLDVKCSLSGGLLLCGKTAQARQAGGRLTGGRCCARSHGEGGQGPQRWCEL